MLSKMYMKIITIVLYLFRSVYSYPSVKDIHDAYALNPVEINDFYVNPNYVNPNYVNPNNVNPNNVSSHPEPLVSSETIVEETVKEVEELIKSNPKLPRLTRGEIIDIIENITKTDSNALRTREEGKRALMVVMPFTAGSAQGDDIKELYTRTPVTHIIGGQPLQPIQKEQKKNRRRPTFPPIQLPDAEIPNLHNLPTQKTTVSPIIQTKINKILLTTTTTSPNAIKVDTENSSSSTHTNSPSTHSSTIQFRPKPNRKNPKPQRKYPNHKYPGESIFSNTSQDGIHIINAPQLSPMQYHSKYSAPFTISLNKLQPVTTEVSKPPTTERNIIDDIPIPENYRHVVKDLNLLINTDYDETEKPKLQKVTTTEKVITSQRSHTTSTKMPNISNVVENLSPDMKDLLMNFGLLDDPNKKPTVIIPTEHVPYQQNAEIKPESYLSFKPLPDTAPSRSEMEEFLARFGLGRSSFRSQKSIPVNKPNKEISKNSEFNMDVIPDNMKHVMKDLGFSTNIKEIQSLNQISDQSKHIFNPSIQNATEEELNKLSKLLDMIKDLEKLNGTITQENLKNIDINSLRELIGDFNGHKFVPLNEQDAPNPLNYDHTEQKSGVKRQENTTTTSTTSTIESATEKTESQSLLDLEASFGVQPDATTRITTTTEPTTTTPRTGFFFLMDWNSFLELDDQLGKRVTLRFQPHSGDPRLFQSIAVP